MSRADTIQHATDKSIPYLPLDSPEFWADPEKFVAPARARHPWLARFSQGLVIHGCQANKDLLAEDENLHMGLDGIVDFYGAQDTAWADFMRGMLNSQRGLDHARIRKGVAHAFTARSAKAMRPRMQQVITCLLDEWAPKGAFDFADFAGHFPVAVMCAVLGVSTEPIPRLRAALEAQLAAMTLDKSVMPDFLAGYEVMWEFADELVRDREAESLLDPDLLLDAMILAKRDGSLDDRELRYLIMVLLFAGYDTTKNMLGMLINLLIDRPEIYARCAKDRDYCRAVVEEGLRHSTIATPFRQVIREFDYDGVRFPKGALMAMATPLGGRDPQAFSDPLTFDPDRERESSHPAFGRGVHFCIGQYLARQQLEEGLHLIAGRIQAPHRDGPIAWRPFLGAWGLRNLPIRFTDGEH